MNTQRPTNPRVDDAHSRVARWLLGVLALFSLIPGVCAAGAPHAFYDNILGVDVLGPYNQHLLTDIGGLYLGFGMLFAWATVTLGRELALVACAAWSLTQVLHVIYHATHLANLTLTQAIEQTVGLVVSLLLPLATALVIARANHAPSGP